MQVSPYLLRAKMFPELTLRATARMTVAGDISFWLLGLWSQEILASNIVTYW